MASLHKQNETYFFRILLERSLQFLRIPRKFTCKYGSNLPNPVILKPPDGTEWKIFWTKSESGADILFQNGWKEFVRYYSLYTGYLVLFKYVEPSHFDVLLFDKTTLQIEYPAHGPYDENPNLDDQFRDDSVEILGEKPSHLKVKSKLSKPPLLSPRPQKKPKFGTNGDFESSSTLKSNHLHVQTEGRQSQGRELEKSINGNSLVKCTKKELEEDVGGNVISIKKYPNSEKKTRMQKLTATEKTEALKRVKTFRSENPFFIVVIQPSYVTNKSPLNIPLKFADEHMEKRQGTIVLEVLEGRTWSATYNGHKILSGWHKFASDNNLKVGDACVFEMTNSTELSFKVLIYRAPEDPSFTFSQGKTLKPKVPGKIQNTVKRPLGKAMSYEFPNPFFKVLMQKSYVSGRSDLRIPVEFAKKYFNIKNSTMLLTLRIIDGRLWSVKYTSRLNQGRICYELRYGWKQFVVDNDLKIGDVCVFELINRMKLTFDVSIFRDAKDGARLLYLAQGTKVNCEDPEIKPDIETKKVCTSDVKPENPWMCDQFRSQVTFGGKSTQRISTSLLKHGGNGVLQDVEKFESDNPYFRVFVRPYHVQSGKPSVPKSFCMSCTTDREKNMLIQVGERSWHAKLLCAWQGKSSKFSAGWPKFARENNLQVGDVCVFELVNREAAVVEAHIFRCQG